MTEMTFTLSSPLEYQVQGSGLEKTETLTLKAPPFKVKKPQQLLKAEFLGASTKFAAQMRASGVTGDGSGAEEYSKIPAKEIMHVFYASGDIEKTQELFKNLLYVDGVCTVGDGSSAMPLKPVDYDNISAEDIDRLMGEYLENFLSSSWV